MFRSYLIKTADRSSKTADSGNCQISFTTPIEQGTYQISSCALPNTQYNLPNGYNYVYWSFNSAPSTILSAQIVAGEYTTSTIASALQTCLNSTGAGGFTVSFSSTTNCLTVANASSFALRFSNNPTYSCERQLGWIVGQDTAYGTSLTAPNGVQLLCSLGYLIQIFEASTRIVNSDNTSGGSAYYPKIGTYGEVQIYNNHNSHDQYIKLLSNCSTISIRITDSLNRLVALNGADLEMLITQVN